MKALWFRLLAALNWRDLVDWTFKWMNIKLIYKDSQPVVAENCPALHRRVPLGPLQMSARTCPSDVSGVDLAPDRDFIPLVTSDLR
jgi:hypothetical protein